VSYNFAFPDYVAGVVHVFVDYIKLVDGVVLVADDVFVPDHALGTGTVKYLTHNRFAAAKVASVCASAIHG
jgi:hypothetical protein